jgi:hypothetical protein
VVDESVIIAVAAMSSPKISPHVENGFEYVSQTSGAPLTPETRLRFCARSSEASGT